MFQSWFLSFPYIPFRLVFFLFFLNTFARQIFISLSAKNDVTKNPSKMSTIRKLQLGCWQTCNQHIVTGLCVQHSTSLIASRCSNSRSQNWFSCFHLIFHANHRIVLTTFVRWIFYLINFNYLFIHFKYLKFVIILVTNANEFQIYQRNEHNFWSYQTAISTFGEKYTNIFFSFGNISLAWISYKAIYINKIRHLLKLTHDGWVKQNFAVNKKK